MRVDNKIQSSGWEVRAHGNRSNRIFTSMAVAPTQPAAGVTESGNFSQSDEDLAARGLSCHFSIDDLDLDQLNSLFSKVCYASFRTFSHNHFLCRFFQPYPNHQPFNPSFHQEPATISTVSKFDCEVQL